LRFSFEKGIQHLGLCQVFGFTECLKGCSAEAVFASVRTLTVILFEPLIDIRLELFKRGVDFLAEGDRIEFLANRLVKAFGDAVGLWMTCFGLGMVNIFQGKVEFILMVLQAAQLFRAAVSQNA
jgi:hypothetical protein